MKENIKYEDIVEHLSSLANDFDGEVTDLLRDREAAQQRVDEIDAELTASQLRHERVGLLIDFLNDPDNADLVLSQYRDQPVINWEVLD